MTREKIIIPRWLLERIEDTLRIQHNINLDKKSGETCQDRNIKESLNGVRKLLNGEELTGCERLEKLQSSLPEGLEEAAKNRVTENGRFPISEFEEMRIKDIKFGAEWQKAKMLEGAVEGKVFMSFAPGHNQMVMADVDLPTNTKVKVIIVKEGQK